MGDCQEAEAAVKNLGHVAVYSSVEKVGLLKSTRVVVVAENALFVFPKKSGKPQNVYSYLTLEECKVNNTKIKMKFGGDSVSIESKQADSFMSAFNGALALFLAPKELEKFGLQMAENQSTFVIYSRLNDILEQRRIALDSSTLELLMSTILYKNTRIALPGENVAAVRVFLQILPLCKFIHEVTFPAFEFTKQDIEWLKQSSHVRYFSFTGKVGRDVLECLKEMKPFMCSFSNDGLSKDDLKVISEIPSLGNEFHGVFDLNTLQYFYSDYLEARKLAVINVDGTPSLNIRALLEHARDIVCLSVGSCNLEISYTLGDLASLDLKKLRVLNLAGNVCNKQPDGVDLPGALFTLNVDNVHWGKDCLVSFLSLVLNNFPKGLRLSISQAEADDEEWNKVFSFFATVDHATLASLSWNCNPVRAELFEMLKHSESLEYLSMNGCFSEKDSVAVLNFTSFLKTVVGLKCLIARGTKDRYLGTSIFNVLRAIRPCSPIEILDLQDSRCGDDGIDQFREAIVPNTTIKIIAFDGIMPKKLDSLQALITDLSAKNSLLVSYPDRDMALLGKPQGVPELKAKLSLGADPEASSRFFQFYHELAFPNELDQAVLDKLRDENPRPVRQLKRSLSELQHLNVTFPVIFEPRKPEIRHRPIIEEEPRVSHEEERDSYPARPEPQPVHEKKEFDLKATPRRARNEGERHSLLLEKPEDAPQYRPRSNTLDISAPSNVNQEVILSKSEEEQEPKPQERTRQPPIKATMPRATHHKEQAPTQKGDSKRRAPVPTLPRDRLSSSTKQITAKEQNDVIRKKSGPAKVSSARRETREEHEMLTKKRPTRRTNDNEKTRSRDETENEHEHKVTKTTTRQRPASARSPGDEEEPEPRKGGRKKAMSFRISRGQIIEEEGETPKRGGIIREETPLRNAKAKLKKISQEQARTVPRTRRKTTSDTDDTFEQKQKPVRKLPPKPPAKITWKMPKMTDITFDQRVWVQKAQPYSVGIIFNEIKYEMDDSVDEPRNQTLERIE